VQPSPLAAVSPLEDDDQDEDDQPAWAVTDA
jgi:hypothetical protein